MKKFLCIISAFLVLSTGLKADEGMWLLPLLEKMNIKTMNELGCRLSAEEIYSVNHSSLKDAIVHFGRGCTGEIISKEGLLVTNHHCGYGSIQQVSSDEHNYLQDGFWAMNRNEEIPIDGLTVTFLEHLEDVTAIITKAEKKAIRKYRNDECKKSKIKDAVIKAKKEIVEKAKVDYPNCDIILKDFYSENVYYLIVNKIYKDIRFVGAPPARVGKFGGDTDNWMWPRHTCDFSMFRVYADKDNNPAEYSKDNVPYTPKQNLKISLKGIEKNDFAMIIGYPGRTQRYMTADQLQDMLDQNDIRIAARTIRQDIMMKYMEADPSVRLKYANKYAGSSNGWKKWIGEKKAFENLEVIPKEEAKEAKFMKWVNAKSKRQENYGDAIQQIEKALNETKSARTAFTIYIESIYKIELANIRNSFLKSMNDYLKTNSDADTTKALAFAYNSLIENNVYKDYYEPLDREASKAMMKFYQTNSEKQYWPNLGKDVDFSKVNVDKIIDKIFNNSIFTNQNSLKAAVDAGDYGIIKDDSSKEFSTMFNLVFMNILQPYFAARNTISASTKDYTAGLMAWNKGKAMYPDANSTMRLTYGTVKGYSPKDAVIYKYYTTTKGVREKNDPNSYDFDVPQKLLELIDAKDYGQYTMANGEMPTCFLTNNDITGGNSGSPVLDADGNLLGLAFDGNWESLSSDVLFEKDLQRCINVDIRYVLFIVDKLGGAHHLIEEMDLVK